MSTSCLDCAAGVAQRSVARQPSAKQLATKHAARRCGEAGSSPRSRDDDTCVYMVARRRAAILSDNSGRSAYGSSPRNRQRNKAMTVARDR
jgi:hypothetical protein